MRLFSITEIIGLFVVYQTLFFAANLLFGKRPKPRFNKILAALLVTIALNFSNMLLMSQELIRPEFNFGAFFGLTYGPLFFLYGQSLMNKSINADLKTYLYHFVPAFAVLLLLLLTNYYPILLDGLELITVVIVIHILAYLYFTLIDILKFQKSLKEIYSSVDSRNLSWLKNLILIFTGVVIVLVLEALVPSDFLPKSEGVLLNVIYVAVLILVNFIYYKGLSQPGIFSNEPTPVKGEKYASSKLDSDQSDRIQSKLIDFMTKEKPYLEFDLTLKTLSESLDVSTRQLSQVVNERMKMNFYDFVNSYRVEEAKRLLLEGENDRFRINEIMYDAGFSSKSTFNSTFKNKTGLTPKEFRQNNSQAS